jgi:hypothetical protein
VCVQVFKWRFKSNDEFPSFCDFRYKYTLYNHYSLASVLLKQNNLLVFIENVNGLSKFFITKALNSYNSRLGTIMHQIYMYLTWYCTGSVICYKRCPYASTFFLRYRNKWNLCTCQRCSDDCVRCCFFFFYLFIYLRYKSFTHLSISFSLNNAFKSCQQFISNC